MKLSKNRKINKMTNNSTSTTFISSMDKTETVRYLLKDSWIKEDGSLFYKVRNKYVIKLLGKNHPMWEILVEPKVKNFDEGDWKLRQDFKYIKNLGKKLNKNLYINENNREEIIGLVSILLMNGYTTVYNDNYVIFLEGESLTIIKIAAKMNLKFKDDGWYMGKKKII